MNPGKGRSLTVGSTRPTIRRGKMAEREFDHSSVLVSRLRIIYV